MSPYLDKRNISLLFICLIISFFAKGQDYQFSQFNKAPLMINPANTGMGKGYNRFNLMYHVQHPAAGFVYRTYYFSADGPVFSHQMKASKALMSIGFHAFQDRSGDSKLSKLDVGLSLSTYVDIDDYNQFSFGMQGNFVQHSISVDNIQWASQYNGAIGAYDPSISSGEIFANNSSILLNTGVGVLLKHLSRGVNLSGIDKGSFQIGYAAYNLLRPQKFMLNSLDRIYVRHVIHGRSLIALNEKKYGLAPQFLIHKQGPHVNATIGTDIKYYVHGDTKYTGFISEYNVGVGFYYRHKDAIITNFSVQFNNMNISLSYDLSIGPLSAFNGTVGGFALGIQFNDTYGVLFNQGNMHVVNRSRRMRKL